MISPINKKTVEITTPTEQTTHSSRPFQPNATAATSPIHSYPKVGQQNFFTHRPTNQSNNQY